MAYRGRSAAKRRPELSFSLESIGLTRGEALPPPTVLPPPLYPSLDLKASPLRITEVDNYFLTLKQEFRQSLITSAYYINPLKEKPKIERYSDKYENIANKSNVNESDVRFDWKMFPIELRPLKRVRRSAKHKNRKQIPDIASKLDNLANDDNEEQSSGKSEDETENNANENDDNVTDEESKEIEDIEEGTDYTYNYFDNGENYLEDSDDNMDEGPTY